MVFSRCLTSLMCGAVWLGGVGVATAYADGRQLGARDLVSVSEVGLSEFQRIYGAQNYASIYAITSALNEDGDGATLNFYYGDPARRDYASFFCHEHGPGELDCHEVSR